MSVDLPDDWESFADRSPNENLRSLMCALDRSASTSEIAELAF
jgi:hypothetical protein